VNRMNRRSFVEKALSTAGAVAVTSWSGALAFSRPSATDQVTLGRSGIKASRIAMGTGFRGSGRSSNQVRLGRAAFNRLMRHGFDSGLNFFDMADLYGSHPYMRDVIREVGRDRVVLLSKIWFAEGGGMEPTDRAIPAVDRFRSELEVDHLDVCLIHCVTSSQWPQQLQRMRDELSELKQRGVIRATGVSCHDFGALKVAASDPWVDIIFARINPRGKVMDVPDVDAVANTLEQARANGKGVVGMKIFGAGELAETAQREESLRYVWGRDLIDAMTIGFEAAAQVDDTIARLNRVFEAA
jgi:aryl-alcohol dehydrogenase-like predicted oxidoreductase